MAGKEDKLKQAFDMIEEGVKNVYSSDKFKDYISVLSKFHNYSFNNVMLILSQRPNATLVAGFTSWQDKFQRHVNKGEKAIKILAPYQIKVKSKDPQKEDEEETITKFRVVNVFDVSQTSGKPLPQLVDRIQGTSLNAIALMESIKELCKIPIEFHTKENDLLLLDGVYGYYDRNSKNIVVLDELEDIHKCKTLAHEYIHSLLHEQTMKQQDQREIEAEASANVICDYFGIDTSSYSYPYIASYASNDMDILKSTLIGIQMIARELISQIQPIYDEKYKQLLAEQQANKDYRLLTPIELEEMSQPIIELLKSKLQDHQDVNIHVFIDQVIEANRDELLKNYSFFLELYGSNEYYQKAIIESLLDEKDRPFIELSAERELYNQFAESFNALLVGKSDFMYLTAKYHDDISIELIDENQIALSQFEDIDGDLVTKLDIVLKVDDENQLIYPITLEEGPSNPTLDINQDPGLKEELQARTKQFLNSITTNRYAIQRIMGKGYDLHDPHSIQSFCKEHQILNYARNQNYVKIQEVLS